MSTTDRERRLDDERRQLEQAAQRLLTGAPQRDTTGRLSIAALATEADIPRQRLYEHHPRLIADFKTAITGGPIPPNIQALQLQLADARDRINQLEAENHQLRAQITTLCAVITELTHEAHAENVIAMPVRRSRPR